MIRIVWVVMVGLAACAPRAVPPAGPVRAADVSQPAAIHWTRSSAEHRASFLQTYAWAEERLRALSAGKSSGSWAVILDADETVIDNSTYQKERAAVGGAFTEETWSEWVRRREARALPGATAFIRGARSLGGRVVIVTNRSQAQCDDTRANFVAQGITVDLVLCRPPESSDKNPRFAAVQNGTAAPGVQALEVLMWVGDNIQDFPALTQQLADQPESAFSGFGQRYIVLPNPMYGSWERNPAR